MNIRKRILVILERVYSLAQVKHGVDAEGFSFVAGSEGDGSLVFFESPRKKPVLLAERPGGFISLQGFSRDGHDYLLASVDFKPGFQAENCAIVLYDLKRPIMAPAVTVAQLPFTHRIAVADVGGVKVFLGATLCSAKKSREDWSSPGAIYLAALPDDLGALWELARYDLPLTKNHGMDYAVLNDHKRGYLISAQEGLFFLQIPPGINGQWQFETISSEEHSDAWAYDLDGTGQADIFTLSPFHGNVLSRYRQTQGRWDHRVIDETVEFGHFVWAGELLGQSVIIVGERGATKALYLYRYQSATDTFVRECIDEGIGASQMLVNRRQADKAQLIVAANALDQVICYDISK